ncbi:hypothetical protein GTW46_11240, partial [Streptomyces sp. SID6013]|nr:hypothetical protein [Streptomyces sp. SID6013]
RAAAAARRALGGERYDVELAEGAVLTPRDVAAELESAVGQPVPQAPTRR